MVANPAGSITVESQLYSYSVDGATGKLQQISQVGTGGKDTTHLAFDAASNTLFGASHASGEVTALPVQPDGSPGKVVSGQKHYGTGPLPRQGFPQAHAVAIDPTHRYLLSADFGADRFFCQSLQWRNARADNGGNALRSDCAGLGPATPGIPSKWQVRVSEHRDVRRIACLPVGREAGSPAAGRGAVSLPRRICR
jgi:6-phosphogluconolactonase (cycloisomerase 2 family)